MDSEPLTRYSRKLCLHPMYDERSSVRHCSKTRMYESRASATLTSPSSVGEMCSWRAAISSSSSMCMTTSRTTCASAGSSAGHAPGLVRRCVGDWIE